MKEIVADEMIVGDTALRFVLTCCVDFVLRNPGNAFEYKSFEPVEQLLSAHTFCSAPSNLKCTFSSLVQMSLQNFMHPRT
jgi:hypothetical protein